MAAPAVTVGVFETPRPSCRLAGRTALSRHRAIRIAHTQSHDPRRSDADAICDRSRPLDFLCVSLSILRPPST